jgi:hypothetical protein
MRMNKMQVINKDNNEIYEVYDIVYHQSGAPKFLIYKDDQWMRVSAKYYKPVTASDLYDVDPETGMLKVL